jgi:hypothetical protein
MCPTPIFADVSQSSGSNPLLTCDPHRAGEVKYCRDLKMLLAIIVLVYRKNVCQH